MTDAKKTLYYIHDPMCSWCWGFRKVWQSVQNEISGTVNIKYLLGGLAADTDQLMPADMQNTIKHTWLRIQQEIPGTRFNFDFWSQCRPRRSTYPACRAVVAAGMQGENYRNIMLLAIQQAYYLRAENPSDVDVLVRLSEEIGLVEKQFVKDLLSERCARLFREELRLVSALGISSFPSLVLNDKQSNTMINIDYNKSETIVSSILTLV